VSAGDESFGGPESIDKTVTNNGVLVLNIWIGRRDCSSLSRYPVSDHPGRMDEQSNSLTKGDVLLRVRSAYRAQLIHSDSPNRDQQRNNPGWVIGERQPRLGAKMAREWRREPERGCLARHWRRDRLKEKLLATCYRCDGDGIFAKFFRWMDDHGTLDPWCDSAR
jgi:hypothetical protein